MLFWLLSNLRKILFKLGIKQQIKVDCPVVVVGNIGIGGNGKTPIVIYLVEQLKAQGVKVGVISRGYGGNAPHYPYLLTESSTALEAGDEPVLIYQRCQIPVIVGADRIASANALKALGCQIIISDDGLQHYRLARDYEICVVDSKRLFGNGLLLPSGPLRESKSRLNSVDHIIFNGEVEDNHQAEFKNLAVDQQVMTLKADSLCNMLTSERQPLSKFLAENKFVDAIAGIGAPQRFFDTLTQLGFKLEQQQGFNDHQSYQVETFTEYGIKQPLVMTEKDAVKCKSFAKANWWYLPVDALFAQNNKNELLADIMKLIKN